MKHVKKTVLLSHSAHEMYELVTSVEDYPKFLPWCARAQVLERHPDGVTAKLHLSYAGLHHGFTTRNVHTHNTSVIVSLVDGPFSLLDGHWRFLPLGHPGDVSQQGCKIDFDLRYAFASTTLEAVVSPVFDRIANTLVDSFVRRAEQVYGPR